MDNRTSVLTYVQWLEVLISNAYKQIDELHHKAMIANMALDNTKGAQTDEEFIPEIRALFETYELGVKKYIRDTTPRKTEYKIGDEVEHVVAGIGEITRIRTDNGHSTYTLKLGYHTWDATLDQIRPTKPQGTCPKCGKPDFNLKLSNCPYCGHGYYPMLDE